MSRQIHIYCYKWTSFPNEARILLKMSLERLFTCAQHLNYGNFQKDLLRYPSRLHLTRDQY